MAEIKFTEEEIRERKPETIKNFAEFLHLLIEQSKNSKPESTNPNEVRICVTEDLNMGEKLGG